MRFNDVFNYTLAHSSRIEFDIKIDAARIHLPHGYLAHPISPHIYRQYLSASETIRHSRNSAPRPRQIKIHMKQLLHPPVKEFCCEN
jgi:hypothetical protein